MTQLEWFSNTYAIININYYVIVREHIHGLLVIGIENKSIWAEYHSLKNLHVIWVSENDINRGWMGVPR